MHPFMNSGAKKKDFQNYSASKLQLVESRRKKMLNYEIGAKTFCKLSDNLT